MGLGGGRENPFAVLAGAITRAAELQAESAEKAGEIQQDFFDRSMSFLEETYSQSREDLSAFRELGESAIPELQASAGLRGPEEQQAFLDNLFESPAFKFQEEQGLKLLQQSAASRGLLDSGEFAKELSQFGQGLASQTISAQQDRLAQLVGIGQGSAIQQSNLASQQGGRGADLTTNAGANQANAVLAAGNARAQGIVGSAQAILSGALAGFR